MYGWKFLSMILPRALSRTHVARRDANTVVAGAACLAKMLSSYMLFAEIVFLSPMVYKCSILLRLPQNVGLDLLRVTPSNIENHFVAL